MLEDISEASIPGWNGLCNDGLDDLVELRVLRGMEVVDVAGNLHTVIFEKFNLARQPLEQIRIKARTIAVVPMPRVVVFSIVLSGLHNGRRSHSFAAIENGIFNGYFSIQ